LAPAAHVVALDEIGRLLVDLVAAGERATL
jgi:hypothetical protein